MKLFPVGCAVRCVDANNLSVGMQPIEKGRVYTVRTCREYTNFDGRTAIGVTLEGVLNVDAGPDEELAYRADRFTPLPELVA